MYQIDIPYEARTHFMLLIWAVKHSFLECQLVFFSLLHFSRLQLLLWLCVFYSSEKIIWFFTLLNERARSNVHNDHSLNGVPRECVSFSRYSIYMFFDDKESKHQTKKKINAKHSYCANLFGDHKSQNHKITKPQNYT